LGRGGGRRGGWLWADRDRHTDTLTRVGVCEALPPEMQGGGEMATSLRRDGTHVSGNAAATTTKPTHTITTGIAAAAATRRAAGQECSMACISTPPTCTAAVGCVHAGEQASSGNKDRQRRCARVQDPLVPLAHGVTECSHLIHSDASPTNRMARFDDDQAAFSSDLNRSIRTGCVLLRPEVIKMIGPDGPSSGIYGHHDPQPDRFPENDRLVLLCDRLQRHAYDRLIPSSRRV